jgi:hypothetical protein
MNKLINFIESEWSRPAIVCFTIFLMFFFTFFLSLAEKREANRIDEQRVVEKQIQNYETKYRQIHGCRFMFDNYHGHRHQ